VSRRLRSFVLCLAFGAILALALPGVAAGAPRAATTTQNLGAAGDTSGIPTRFAGGCESHLHNQQSPLTDLQQQT
jgi:hypothetical protein